MKILIGKSKSGKSWVYLGNHGVTIKSGRISESYSNISKENAYWEGGFTVSKVNEGVVLDLTSNKRYISSDSFVWLKKKRRCTDSLVLDVGNIRVVDINGRYIGSLCCTAD